MDASELPPRPDPSARQTGDPRPPTGSTADSVARVSQGSSTWVSALLGVTFGMLGFYFLWRFVIRRCFETGVSKAPLTTRGRRIVSAYDIESPDDAHEFGHVLSPKEIDRTFPEHRYTGPFSDSEVREISMSYKEMMAFESRIDSTNPDELRDRSGATDCLICLLPFHPRLYNRTTPCCKHEFHSDCLATWLNTRRGVCPFCRHEYVRRFASPSSERAVHMGYNEFAASTRTRAFSIGTHSIAANSVVTVVTGGPESGPEPPIPSPEEATLTLTPPPMARVR